MPKKVRIEGLADEIARTMQEYTEDVEKGIEREADKIADSAVKELQATSPKRTGKYGKGWAKRKEKDMRIIYNKNKPGLAHLLEHGHAKRGGGRVAGIPHIKPVEERVIKDFENVVIEVIERG